VSNGTSSTDVWRALGRLLPSDVRERIFEPAFSDLLYAWLTAADGDRWVPFGVRAVGTYVGCFPIAVPLMFVRDGRLTRFGRVTVWSTAIVSISLLVLLGVSRSYPS